MTEPFDEDLLIDCVRRVSQRAGVASPDEADIRTTINKMVRERGIIDCALECTLTRHEAVSVLLAHFQSDHPVWIHVSYWEAPDIVADIKLGLFGKRPTRW